MKSRRDKFHILPIGDIHYGSPSCDTRFLNGLLQWVLTQDNVYVIGMGDYIDATHHHMPWYDAETTQKMIDALPMSQRQGEVNKLSTTIGSQSKWIRETLRPLAEAGKIIALHQGNHDMRLANITGYNWVADMCQEFGVKWLGHSALTRLAFRRINEIVSWDIFSTHGKYRGTTPGGKISKLEKLVSMFEADCYLHGDAHDLITYQHPRIHLNNKANKEERNKTLVLTGSFVRSYGDMITYSEEKDMKPVNIGCPKLTFIPNKRVLEVSVYSTDSFKTWDD